MTIRTFIRFGLHFAIMKERKSLKPHDNVWVYVRGGNTDTNYQIPDKTPSEENASEDVSPIPLST